jgi:hypothetical protein
MGPARKATTARARRDEIANAPSEATVTAVALLLALLAASPGAEPPAEAKPSPPSSVETVGQCPTAEAVELALRAALGAAPDRAGAGAPRVTDLGDQFEVTVLGQTHQYADAGRDCDERARVAAVFIALTLNPPTFVAPPRPPPPPPPPAVEVHPVAPPTPAEHRLDVALALRLDGGESGASTVTAPGAELAVAFGGRIFGLAASAAVLAPTESRLGSVTVREQRFPIGLAVTARGPLSGPIDGTAALGLALVPFTLDGVGLASPQPATRLDTGGRVALGLALHRNAGGLAPFFEVHAEIFPRTYVLAVGPLGELGSTTHLWLGAAAGVAFERR